MEKFEYYIKDLHPSDFFNSEIDILKSLKKVYKKIKITPRGDKLLLEGENTDILKLCVVLDSLIYFLKQNENLNESNLNQIIKGKGDKLLKPDSGRVILFGTNKKKIKAHTLKQIKIIEAFENNDMVFAIGPAGTGKTYTGVALAVKALKDKDVKRIILTRPAVEAGENLGFLPGDLKDKLDPYMQPLYDALKEMIQI